MTSDPAPPADGPTRAPDAAADRRLTCRAEREQWQRRLRLQRQLHDGASLRISALVPQLGVVRTRVPDAQPDLDASIEGLQDQLHTVLQELREIARAIYPPVLDEAGLGPALRDHAEHTDVVVRVDVGPERFGPAVEGAAYFAVTGCLAALPPGSPPVEVSARREGDALVLVLSGVPPRSAPVVADQVCGLGGEVTTGGAPEGGTIEARIPCG
ncbi:sensor histidine kinase [Geodermatophilus chilensis]|jgi:signal transduction histidine kinase|uniref:sensor histidine kinase n=1 Tax=Geodermatophilus chilensis TaxID=2035835 RepID=UPI000C262671|nr:histidine kinase [Geodermatophilus chilensis]